MSKRTHLAEMGYETLGFLRAGCYTCPSGNLVSIARELAYARMESRLYPPGSLPEDPPETLPEKSAIEVTPETTLAAARRLDALAPCCNPCCLNFASARNPGGGFLSGARAQEESLARSSALYACIAPMREMYDYNRQLSTCLYSDYMIYSPRVPVFRDDEGTLLEQPYLASFITAPAVNAGVLHAGEYSQIESTMRRRAELVLRVAHRHRHQILVLGAWGCGAFRNDPDLVARVFAELLEPGGVFHNVFAQVVFAIVDHGKREDNFRTFQARLLDKPAHLPPTE
jgi:uncharacterized protein (TIGR02452 family)